MAQIVENRIALPFNRFRYEYEWQGEDSETARIDLWRRLERRPLPQPMETFWLGHLELVIVDYRIEYAQHEVMLAGGRGFQAAYRRRLFYWWANVRSRIILTLYVWGLADAPQGEILTWKHIHWGRK